MLCIQRICFLCVHMCIWKNAALYGRSSTLTSSPYCFYLRLQPLPVCPALPLQAPFPLVLQWYYSVLWIMKKIAYKKKFVFFSYSPLRFFTHLWFQSQLFPLFGISYISEELIKYQTFLNFFFFFSWYHKKAELCHFTGDTMRGKLCFVLCCFVHFLSGDCHFCGTKMKINA